MRPKSTMVRPLVCRTPPFAPRSHIESCLTAAAVSADADTLRLERENSSLLDEQVIRVRNDGFFFAS
jgi:hypothetical protein